MAGLDPGEGIQDAEPNIRSLGDERSTRADVDRTAEAVGATGGRTQVTDGGSGRSVVAGKSDALADEAPTDRAPSDEASTDVAPTTDSSSGNATTESSSRTGRPVKPTDPGASAEPEPDVPESTDRDPSSQAKAPGDSVDDGEADDSSHGPVLGWLRSLLGSGS